MQKNLPVECVPNGVAVIPQARLSAYTTFRLGGSCRALLECASATQLTASIQQLAAAEIDYLLIGQGSNLLVSDAGIEQVILRYCTDVPRIEFDGNRVTVSGDTLVDALAEKTIDQGLGDVAFCSGIPGTVGGAIVGNAGAFGQQIGDVVESVLLLDRSGNMREESKEELEFTYRSSALKQSGEVVLSAVLRLESMDRVGLLKERERILELRRNKHPNWRDTPSAGSVFRNVEPTSAAGRRQASGWFLEQAGAKNLTVGGARLFDGHANIIVTDATATAQDVYELSEQMRAAVREHFGFNLVREIRLLGPF